MVYQQELSPELNYNYQETESSKAAESQFEPTSNEKSPQALRVFVVGKHLEMLRNEVIDKGNK